MPIQNELNISYLELLMKYLAFMEIKKYRNLASTHNISYYVTISDKLYIYMK